METITKINVRSINEKGISVEEAIARVEAMPTYKDQIITNPRFVGQDNLIMVDRQFRGPLVLDADSQAVRQALARAGLSTTWADALEFGGGEEVAALMNKALAARGKDVDYMFRTVDGRAFAALSPAYLRMDTRVAFPSFLRNLDPDTDWKITRLNLNPNLSSGMAVAWDRGREVRRDDLFPALSFYNGDGGASRLRSLGGIFRLLCTNGMTMVLAQMSVTNRAHRGRRQAPGYLDEAGIDPNVINLMPDEAGVFRAFGSSLDLFETAMDARVPGAHEEAFYTGLADVYKLTLKEEKGLAERATQGFVGTIWDATNRITETARDTQSNARRKDLEAAAWTFLQAAAGPTPQEREQFAAHLVKQGELVLARRERS